MHFKSPVNQHFQDNVLTVYIPNSNGFGFPRLLETTDSKILMSARQFLSLIIIITIIVININIIMIIIISLGNQIVSNAGGDE